jgi:hypothetical protein
VKYVQIDKRRTREERELVARLKIFARFQSPEEHESLVDGILKARRLKNQIETLQLYRSRGIRTIEQAKVYEADKKRKEAEAKARRARESTSYLFEGVNSLYGDSSSSSSKRASGAGVGSKRGLPGSDSMSTMLSESDEVVLDEDLSKAPGAGNLVCIDDLRVVAYIIMYCECRPSRQERIGFVPEDPHSAVRVFGSEGCHRERSVPFRLLNLGRCEPCTASGSRAELRDIRLLRADSGREWQQGCRCHVFVERSRQFGEQCGLRAHA